MTTIESTSQELDQPGPPFTLSEDQLAAVAFLARYSGRTLEAYRHDLRCLFQWAADHGLAVLAATRPQQPHDPPLPTSGTFRKDPPFQARAVCLISQAAPGRLGPALRGRAERGCVRDIGIAPGCRTGWCECGRTVSWRLSVSRWLR